MIENETLEKALYDFRVWLQLKNQSNTFSVKLFDLFNYGNFDQREALKKTFPLEGAIFEAYTHSKYTPFEKEEVKNIFKRLSNS